MRARAVVLAVAIVLAPLGAKAADLVVWWEKGFYPQEDEAVGEIVAAFEQETGKQVELVQPAQDEMIERAAAPFEAGAPPDFLFGSVIETSAARWAYDDRLVDLAGVLGPVLDLFDAGQRRALHLARRQDGPARPVRAAHGPRFPIMSMSGTACWSAPASPSPTFRKEWEAFWSFWCDQVQPAVRKALGREDIWAVGLPMSVAATIDTDFELTQFQLAYQAYWLTRDRRAPGRRSGGPRGDGQGLDGYTAIWRKGCTPPDSVSWTNIDNNKAFLAQTVVMTANPTLSIPTALKRERPDDYYGTPPRSIGRGPLTASRSLSRGAWIAPWSSRLAAMPPRPSSSSASSPSGWLAHWVNIHGRPVHAADAQAASSSRSGSTRATRTACARRCRS